MIDPITVAIGSMTVGAINAGISLRQVSKQNDIIKTQKRQRIELGCLEAGFVIALLAPAIENRLVNKKLKELASKNELAIDYNEIMGRIVELEARMEKINLGVIDAKLDAVLAASMATATPPPVYEEPRPDISVTTKED